MTWIKSIGTLAYGPGTERLVLLADQEIADLYHSLVPAYVGLARQAYPAHVSVVRRVTPPNMEAWGKHEGKRLPFEYEDRVEHDETYYWLPVRSEALANVRIELGLPPWPPWANGYHMTIGNLKHEQAERGNVRLAGTDDDDLRKGDQGEIRYGISTRVQRSHDRPGNV